MKRIGNIYNTIIDTNKINNMYKKIKSSTKNKRKIEVFENNYVSNITYIKDVLKNKKYIIDKIINHLVSQYFLVNIFEKSLIEENVATRKNKGTKEGKNIVL